MDRFAPYEFEWPSGASGYYIFFEVLDNQGNRNVSSVMRRSLLFRKPEFDFQPASMAIASAQVDENGSWEKETISNSYSGTWLSCATQVVVF